MANRSKVCGKCGMIYQKSLCRRPRCPESAIGCDGYPQPKRRVATDHRRRVHNREKAQARQWKTILRRLFRGSR